jgi:hypothetical protein
MTIYQIKGIGAEITELKDWHLIVNTAIIALYLSHNNYKLNIILP